jgi:hypothetical protein
VESNLQFWQIYTPDDGKRIAIEPMSFHGNVYEIVKENPHLWGAIPKHGKIRVTVK